MCWQLCIISGVVAGKAGNAVPPNIFVGNAIPPNDISTRENGDTVAFPPSRLEKKCNVYGKLILRKSLPPDVIF